MLVTSTVSRRVDVAFDVYREVQARTQGGGALGARAPPLSPGKKVPLRNVQKRRESSAEICRQKRMCTFRSDTTKLKRKS